MQFYLQVLKDGLSTMHVPYSYGFAIILLTILVKAATFPLTKKQVYKFFVDLFLCNLVYQVVSEFTRSPEWALN